MHLTIIALIALVLIDVFQGKKGREIAEHVVTFLILVALFFSLGWFGVVIWVFVPVGFFFSKMFPVEVPEVPEVPVLTQQEQFRLKLMALGHSGRMGSRK